MTTANATAIQGQQTITLDREDYETLLAMSSCAVFEYERRLAGSRDDLGPIPSTNAARQPGPVEQFWKDQVDRAHKVRRLVEGY